MRFLRRNALNALGILLALPLLGYSLSVAAPQKLASDAQDMLAGASVGLTLGVAENPYNSTAQELKAKEAELSAREAQIQREKGSDTDMFGIYSLIMSTILLVLVGLNFYFDARRSRRGVSAYSINLRR